MAFVQVCPLDDLWGGELKAVAAGGVKVLLVNNGEAVHAFIDRCPHLGVALSKGTFEDAKLRCFAHHWEFDAATGEGLNPKGVRLCRLPVLIEAGYILVDPDGGMH